MTLVVAAFLALWPSLDLAFEGFPAAPPWVRDTFSGRISPGLDIQGGLRLMYEVEVDEAVRDRRDREADRLLRRVGVLLDRSKRTSGTRSPASSSTEIRQHVQAHRVGNSGIRLTFSDAADVELVDRDRVQEYFPRSARWARPRAISIDLVIREERIDALRDVAVEQAVRRRSRTASTRCRSAR